MKLFYKIITLALCLLAVTGAYAQQRTVKFTGRDRTDQYHVQLDRVEIFNLDQVWEEVLYWPDTTLIMGTVGIDNHGTPANVQLMQNVPNPFNGKTTFALILPEDRDLRLEIFDVNGKKVVSENYLMLPAGTHLFEAILTSPQTYLLSATVSDGRMTLKMINEGYGGNNLIRYVGMNDMDGAFTINMKNDKAEGSYPFEVGDRMQYTGYAVLDGMERQSNTVTQPQINDETIPLMFDYTAPTVVLLNLDSFFDSIATASSIVTDDGGLNVTQRGVCWKTTPNPTINDNHTSDGIGLGSYTSTLSGLTEGTTYYVRAYAVNDVSTAYSAEITLTTLALPTVTTDEVTDIASTTATCGGDVITDGGNFVTARGVCWSTIQNPTTSDNHTTDGDGTGTFTSYLTNMLPNTTYYVRAYATNNVGTGYGDERVFTTAITTPTVTTNFISNITYNSAICESAVISDGGNSVIERGICWDTLPNPTMANNHLQIGSGVGTFSGGLTGLTENTLYYVRAYAINSAGTAYGNELVFNAPYGPCPIQPTLVDYDGNVYNTIQIGNQCWMKENLRVTHFDDGTAIPMGPSTGSSSTIAYRYCPNNDNSNVFSYGYLYNWTARMNGADSTSANPSGIQGVCPEGWHVPSDVEWSQLIIHIRNQVKYLCDTSHDNSIAKALASINGWQNNNEDSCNVGFDMLSNNISGFTALPAGARTSVEVHFGAQAILGSTSYNLGGYPSSFRLKNDWSFPVFGYNGKAVAVSVRCVRNNTDTILNQYCPGAATVTDYDGNVYKTIKIGDQCWMRENLRTTHYADATSIPVGTTWSETVSYRYYPNDNINNVLTYGYLYNWVAVMHGDNSINNDPIGVQGICPTGWHMPSITEWTQLTDYIGSQSVYVCGNDSSYIAKSIASTTGWNNSTNDCSVGNNQNTNNATGFNALPAGFAWFYYDKHFGDDARFWTSSKESPHNTTATGIVTTSSSRKFAASPQYAMDSGYSVRCLKD